MGGLRQQHDTAGVAVPGSLAVYTVEAESYEVYLHRSRHIWCAEEAVFAQLSMHFCRYADGHTPWYVVCGRHDSCMSTAGCSSVAALPSMPVLVTMWQVLQRHY